jgi:hypothetical protein
MVHAPRLWVGPFDFAQDKLQARALMWVGLQADMSIQSA